jgi:hypothetical protein
MGADIANDVLDQDPMLVADDETGKRRDVVRDHGADLINADAEALRCGAH